MSQQSAMVPVPVQGVVIDWRASLRAVRRALYWVVFMGRLLQLPRMSVASTSGGNLQVSSWSWSRFWLKEDDASVRRALARRKSKQWDLDKSGTVWRDHLFVNSRGQTIFTQSWAPAHGEHVKGIVAILHGLNEHRLLPQCPNFERLQVGGLLLGEIQFCIPRFFSLPRSLCSGRYARFAKQLNRRGYTVFGMDWIGHGGSDGLHGYVESLDHAVSDTEDFLLKASAEYPGKPIFLFGHSTGGAIVLKAALRGRLEKLVTGMILTSPALRVQASHPVVTVVAPLFSILLPRYQFRAANRRGLPVTSDPVEQVAKYSDPLVYTGPIRIRTGTEILRITAFLQKNLHNVSTPFFVLHGTEDKVTDPAASQSLYDLASAKEKKIKLYEGLLHDLLFEVERDSVTLDIIEWLDGIVAGVKPPYLKQAQT